MAPPDEGVARAVRVLLYSMSAASIDEVEGRHHVEGDCILWVY